jgi:hypothetical protein
MILGTAPVEAVPLHLGGWWFFVAAFFTACLFVRMAYKEPESYMNEVVNLDHQIVEVLYELRDAVTVEEKTALNDKLLMLREKRNQYKYDGEGRMVEK